jgi:hypothetical protein
MSMVLQQVLVAVLVTACALFSVWRLLSARLRLRCLDALAALPGAHTARWLTAARRRALSRLGAGCGACAQRSTPGAVSRNQTPGAPHR